MFNAEVRIELKPGILDAEGRTVKNALISLGFKGVKDVKSIKVFKISIDAESKEMARDKLEEMCEQLLANPVINNYKISFEGD